MNNWGEPEQALH